MNVFDIIRQEANNSRNKIGTYGSLNESIDKIDKKTLWGLSDEDTTEYEELQTNDKNRLLGIFTRLRQPKQNINEKLNWHGVNIDKPKQVL